MQNAEDGAGASDGGDVRIAPRQNVVEDHYANARAHGAEEIKLHEAASSPNSFDVGAEHPERQHVPDDVTESAVQKSVGDQLPDGEILDDVHRSERQVSEGRDPAATS